MPDLFDRNSLKPTFSDLFDRKSTHLPLTLCSESSPVSDLFDRIFFSNAGTFLTDKESGALYG